MDGIGTESAVIDGKTVTVYPSGDEGAPAVYVNMYEEHGRELLEECRGMGCPPFDLVTVSGMDWDAAMSPWPSEPAVSRTDRFTGGAGLHVRFMEDSVIPFAESFLGPSDRRVIAGYSMAGLFALYSPYVSDAFSRVVCVSGSVWYPGLREFVERSRFVRAPLSVYFSIGDRESRVRNELMRTTQGNMEWLHGYYSARGLDTVFELNSGNHFTDTVRRTARGIAWTLGRGERR